MGELKRILQQSKRFIKDGKHINAKTLLEKAIVVYKLDQTQPEFLYLNG
jgi:tetratricopeptide (TPR) repeat protein